MANIARLRDFVADMTRLVERHGADEPRMLDEGEKLLHLLKESHEHKVLVFVASIRTLHRLQSLHWLHSRCLGA